MTHRIKTEEKKKKIKAQDKTVGQYSWELQQKKDDKINPIDLQRAIHKGNDSEDSYENQVRIAVKRGQESFDGDFYIVVLFKKERIMHNTVRQYFMPRKSCPRPEYDQVLYKYNRNIGDLEFVWVIPDKHTVEALPIDKSLVHPEHRELAQFIYDFRTGQLDNRCDALNIQGGTL